MAPGRLVFVLFVAVWANLASPAGPPWLVPAGAQVTVPPTTEAPVTARPPEHSDETELSDDTGEPQPPASVPAAPIGPDAEVSPVLPVLSIVGFLVAAALLGAQWFLTRPGGPHRPTL